MSSNNSEFLRKKNHLLSVLNYFTNKLLFPPQIFDVLKNAKIDNYLSYFIKKYNNTLIKLRSLELELIELKKFGMIRDSEYVWNTSIKWNVANSVNLHKAILESCVGNGMGETWTFKHCNINYKQMNTFMMIYKGEDNKYFFKYKNTKEEFSTEKIIALLPMYRQVNILKSKYVVISSVQELDESNKRIEPSLLTKNEAKILEKFNPVLNPNSIPVLNANSSKVLNSNSSKVLNANSSKVLNSNSKPKADRSLSITSENSNNNIFFNALNTHPNYDRTLSIISENSSVVSNSNSKPKANKSKNSRPIVKINSSLWSK